jgi:hypothetical protein
MKEAATSGCAVTRGGRIRPLFAESNPRHWIQPVEEEHLAATMVRCDRHADARRAPPARHDRKLLPLLRLRVRRSPAAVDRHFPCCGCALNRVEREGEVREGRARGRGVRLERRGLGELEF